MTAQALVPLVTYTDPNSDAVAAHSVAVARQLGVGIHALAVNADIPQVSSALSRLLLDVPQMIQDAEGLSRQRGEHLLALAAEKAREAGVAFSAARVTETPVLLSATAALHARYYDLSLVGWEKDNPTSRATAESIVFGSGRPTVLLPEQVEPKPFDHIAIAWDGSRVAARALADAHLFMARASRVSVLTVVDDKELSREDGERLASALSARGFEAAAVPLRAEGRPVAAMLQQSALDRGCALLVMGAFGHSRMRDFILGGATEGILGDLSLPVLLSH